MHRLAIVFQDSTADRNQRRPLRPSPSYLLE